MSYGSATTGQSPPIHYSHTLDSPYPVWYWGSNPEPDVSTPQKYFNNILMKIDSKEERELRATNAKKIFTEQNYQILMELFNKQAYSEQ